MIAGVYLIVNRKTGQKYVGGSIDIEYRMTKHINSPNNGSYIDNAIQKHGFDNFDWQVIEELPADWGIIGEREKYWINFYNTFKNPEHYNLTKGGEGTSGWIHTKESRKKMSDAHIGKKHTPETCKKMSETRSGENNPMYGVDRSGENNPMWGKEHTSETCKKISKNNARYWEDKTFSEEHKKKISESESQKKTSTGYYRVCKSRDNCCKQGFIYKYQYIDINHKKRTICSVSLKKLEKRVKNKGLPWKILDEEKALKTLNEVSS